MSDPQDHQAAIDEAQANLEAAQRAAEPFVDVSALDPSVAQPGAPDGNDAEFKIVTHDGVSFFHTLATIPKTFLDSLGNVLLGRHHHVTAEGTSPAAPTEPAATPPPDTSSPVPSPGDVLPS